MAMGKVLGVRNEKPWGHMECEVLMEALVREAQQGGGPIRS